jgi:DNA primase
LGRTETRTSRILRRVTGWILPQIVGRPLSPLRCLSGMAAKIFFGKHPRQGVDDGVNRVDTADKEPIVAVSDLAGLKASLVPGLPPPYGADRPVRSKRCDTTNRNAIISLVF